jgi:RNA polymerase sigma-70 factor (ECF subfamily)
MSAKVMENAGVFPVNVKPAVEHFETIFQENYERIYGVLYRLTGHKAEAEDLAMETFFRLWRRSPGHTDQLKGWLYRVAVRLGYNSLRAAKRRDFYERKSLLTPSGSPDPAQEVERARDQLRVHGTLRKMRRREAELLVLHHSGFSYKEIAAALDVSPNSIGTLLARAEREFERVYLKGE